MVHRLLIAFILLFVAVDVAGVLPVYLGLAPALGEAGSRDVAEVASLLLAAMGVTMIRKGLIALVAGHGDGTGRAR
jgi:small neutral amino acid transporter SnatA (MarC family)